MILRRAWERALRFGFYLLYNQMAWSYDAVSWAVSLGQWREWMAAGIPYLTRPDQKPGKALEIAHGPGHMLLALKKAGFDVVGMDLSPFMCRQARRRIQKAGFAIPQLRSDVMKTPFADDSFDHILSTFPAPFIIHPHSLSQLHRVLRPNGRLVIVPQARLSGGGLLQRFIGWLYAVTGQRPDPQLEDSESASASRLCRHISAIGFEATISHVKMKKSVITVVIARKLA